MVANDNCSACEFQNGLASSRRYDENRLERNRKPLGRRVQHSNGWRGGSEPNLFKHVGLEAREIPAVGEVFSLDFPLYRTAHKRSHLLVQALCPQNIPIPPARNSSSAPSPPERARQQRLYFFPLPQGQGLFRPTLPMTRFKNPIPQTPRDAAKRDHS